MTDAYTVRRARPSDYDAIIAVVDEWWGRQISGALPRLFLDHFFLTSAVVESSGVMVAFLVAFLSPSQPEEAYIHFVGVHPEHRHGGLARSLYEAFLAYAAESGRTRVTAVTAASNTGSIAFHERMGFRVSTPIEGYNRRGIAHVVFERGLSPTR
jgi:ribosomal protein S18 acetylase RimI-like enzyme